MAKNDLVEDGKHKEQGGDFSQKGTDHTPDTLKIVVLVVAHLTEWAEVLSPSVLVVKC